ncbi:MAG: PQQ-binding-like beta-propeller repeat protein, partial [Reyranella sp.]|nr:PQQ-binding-like beta-propeller repeat protein [Reyranella sp.]
HTKSRQCRRAGGPGAKAAETGGAPGAFDPVAGRERWRLAQDAVWNGGALATAGDLVFQGTATGEFAAYDARNGRRLWRFDAQRGISSAPISYAVDGRQYVSVLVGWGGLAAFGQTGLEGLQHVGIRRRHRCRRGLCRRVDAPDRRACGLGIELGCLLRRELADHRGVAPLLPVADRLHGGFGLQVAVDRPVVLVERA